MAATATAVHKSSRRELEESRERISRMVSSSTDHGFGAKAWWVGTFLDDEDPYPAIDNMFDQPTPALPAAAPSAATPSVATASAATPQSPATSSATTTTTASISASLFELAAYINQLPKKPDGLISRNKLRKDDNLAAEISRKTGALKVTKRGGRLRRFGGDQRLFDAKMWAWLMDDQPEGTNDDDAAVARGLAAADWGLRSRK